MDDGNRDRLSEEEYREFLNALAKKHLRLPRLHRFGPEGAAHVQYEIERRSSLARFVQVAAENQDDQRILLALGDKLEHAYLGSLVNIYEEAGVLDAIDEDPETLFANLRRTVIPDADLEYLRDAGVRQPDAEVTIIIHYARRHLTKPDGGATATLKRAPEFVAQSGRDLKEIAEREKHDSGQVGIAKKRKLFNGIGKILAGAVTGCGNLLLGLGGIVAPNPAVGYLVLGSSALAIGSVCQGVGDLLGE